MANFWIQKVYAYLHDPPHKPLVLGQGHAEIGRQLAEKIVGQALEPPIADAIKKADHLAAGADRSNFLKDLEVHPRKELSLIHPLDGTPLARERDGELIFTEVPLSPEDVDRARDLVEGPKGDGGERDFSRSVLVEAFSALPDPKLCYLALWRFTTEVLRAAEKGEHRRFGAMWDVLPADTRMPTHSILLHNSLVAALAHILVEGKRPCLLRFQIGPVQPFIEAARSLADLWAGSYWLSELIYSALKLIADELGPDSVLYPRLYDQPLYDLDLCERLTATKGLLKTVVDECKKRLERTLRIPTLPNVFVAIVPEDQAEELSRRCEKEVRKALRERVLEAIKDFELEGQEELAYQQAADLLEVFWAVVPWPDSSGNVRNFLQDLNRAWPKRVSDRLSKVVEATRSLPGYELNDGFLYPIASEQASLAVDAVKRDRLEGRDGREEEGLKCTMCGEREVLGGPEILDQKEFWAEVAKRRKGYFKAGEALCAICLAKRWLGRKGPRGASSWGRPSTAEVATAPFKLHVLKQASKDDKLANAVTEYLRVCNRLGEEYHCFTAPALWRQANDDNLLREFARFDGELLLTMAREELPEDLAEELQKARVNIEKALRTSRPFPRPSPYLAVVVFDGDEMGKWLSGDKAPSLWQMLHKRAQEQVGQARPGLEQVKRPVTPAIHAAISAICSDFAKEVAPYTIEREGLPGYLVYAGGDDALFLASPADALRLVWHLRRRFSGYPHPLPGEGGFDRPFFRSSDSRVHLTFGLKASASAGMCVFHAKHPLGDALEQARAAERRAKDRGRNALGISILRRSGQKTEVVVPFEFTMEGGPTTRPIEDLLKLMEFFQEREVTRSLGFLMRAEFAALRPEAGLAAGTGFHLWDMAQKLVERVIDRRLLRDRGEEDLRGRVTALRKYVQRKDQINLLLEWADWVSVAEFLARPYDAREEV